MATISIIVPVYNAEKYIDRCVVSILAQTFEDWELLLIDDGSTDRSGNLCNGYAQRDNRIRVFHKSNGGVSSARNVGLDEATGKYVVFVDADDWIDNDLLHALIANNHADLTVCDFTLENTDDTCPTDHLNDQYYDFNAIRHLLGTVPASVLLTAPWGKLFNKEIIDMSHLRFNPKIVGGEDTVFVYNYLYHISSVCCTHHSLYHYWISGTGLSCQAHNDESVFKLISELHLICDKLAHKYNIDPKLLHSRLSRGYLYKYIRMLPATQAKDQLNRRIHSILASSLIKDVIEADADLEKGKRSGIFKYVYSRNSFLLMKLWFLFCASLRKSPL